MLKSYIGVEVFYSVFCSLCANIPPLAQEELSVVCRCCPSRGQLEGLWGGCV